MGKILETTYHDTVEKITSFNSSLVNNSFYVLNDKKPSIVTYYNINKEKSSLDPGSKLSYDNIGSESPIRFNKISDFMIVKDCGNLLATCLISFALIFVCVCVLTIILIPMLKKQEHTTSVDEPEA